MAVLVLNSGSSSLKFAVVEPDSGARSLQGEVARIGSADAILTTRASGGEERQLKLPSSDHGHAIRAVLDHLTQAGLHGEVEGVGHRVVHGGEEFSDSALITASVEASIEAASHLAPLHNPANLAGIRAAREAFPGAPQVAVFDTAFHQTMEPRAFRYGVPETWYREHGVRKYGFHGTSHRYVAAEAARRSGRALSDMELLTAHLGNGCSVCAIQRGKSVDTSMGLTPLSGLVMGTRSGDVDPGLVAFMAPRLGVDADQITRDLNERSGLLGLSGISNDMRTLLEARGAGHANAALAIDVFCLRVAACLLAVSASLDRVDALVFTAGIGEHAAPVREAIAAKLWAFGARIDAEANARHGGPTGRISPEGSLPVWAIPTDEEWMIARDTRRVSR